MIAISEPIADRETSTCSRPIPRKSFLCLWIRLCRCLWWGNAKINTIFNAIPKTHVCRKSHADRHFQAQNDVQFDFSAPPPQRPVSSEVIRLAAEQGLARRETTARFMRHHEGLSQNAPASFIGERLCRATPATRRAPPRCRPAAGPRSLAVGRWPDEENADAGRATLDGPRGQGRRPDRGESRPA